MLKKLDHPSLDLVEANVNVSRVDSKIQKNASACLLEYIISLLFLLLSFSLSCTNE